MTTSEQQAVPVAQEGGLRAAAEKARAQFQFYADEHGNAGKYEKARTNAGFAEMLELALSEDATRTREAEGLDRLFSIEPNVGATTNEPSLHTILLGYYLPHFEYDEATRLADAYVAALNGRGGA